MTPSLLDHLQDQGYEPRDETVTSNTREWFDLVSSGTGTIRVIIDADESAVYKFDRYMVCEWSVKFSPGTPSAVIMAVLTAAENELAAANA